MAIINLALTIAFVNTTKNYVSAAYGTAIGFVIANTLIMNIYYWNRLKLNFFRIQFRIMKTSILPLLIASFVTYTFKYVFFKPTWASFFIETIIFILIYGSMLLVFDRRLCAIVKGGLKKIENG